MSVFIFKDGGFMKKYSTSNLFLAQLYIVDKIWYSTDDCYGKRLGNFFDFAIVRRVGSEKVMYRGSEVDVPLYKDILTNIKYSAKGLFEKQVYINEELLVSLNTLTKAEKMDKTDLIRILADARNNMANEIQKEEQLQEVELILEKLRVELGEEKFEEITSSISKILYLLEVAEKAKSKVKTRKKEM